MVENSSVSESKISVVDVNSLSDQEIMLLAMFRNISLRRQYDLLRILEVFVQLKE